MLLLYDLVQLVKHNIGTMYSLYEYERSIHSDVCRCKKILYMKTYAYIITITLALHREYAYIRVTTV